MTTRWTVAVSVVLALFLCFAAAYQALWWDDLGPGEVWVTDNGQIINTEGTSP